MECPNLSQQWHGPFVLELKLWKSLFTLKKSLFTLNFYKLACIAKLVTSLLISTCKIKKKKHTQKSKCFISLAVAVKFWCIFKPFLTMHASCELNRIDIISVNYRVTFQLEMEDKE